VEALKARDPSLTFAALGGPALAGAGVTLLDELTHAAAIGPFDAARHVARFRRALRRLEGHLTTQRPDLVILVDFGDFNLPFVAPMVRRHGVPIVYYISPQVWAWGRFRLRWVRRYVQRMLVLFAFEEAFYRREGIPVTWVGHPLADHPPAALSKDAAMQQLGLNPWRRTVGLLPGSRAAEVARHLPLLLAAAAKLAWRMPGVQFLIPQAAGVSEDLFSRHLGRVSLDVRVTRSPFSDALPALDAAVVASGTATLETALAEVPMVVVYRTSWPTYLAARAVLRVPHIALVNVVAGRAVVPELIQHRATPTRVARELLALLRDDARCARMQDALRQVRAHLGPPGAVDRAAQAILQELRATSFHEPSDRRMLLL
jgi:lipid-A-disaccharide synthase